MAKVLISIPDATSRSALISMPKPVRRNPQRFSCSALPSASLESAPIDRHVDDEKVDRLLDLDCAQSPPRRGRYRADHPGRPGIPLNVAAGRECLGGRGCAPIVRHAAAGELILRPRQLPWPALDLHALRGGQRQLGVSDGNAGRASDRWSAILQRRAREFGSSRSMPSWLDTCLEFAARARPQRLRRRLLVAARRHTGWQLVSHRHRATSSPRASR